MANITTRAGKGSPLTNAEVDANFTNLNAELLTKQDALGYTPANKAGDTFTGAVLTSNAGGFTANSAAKLWTDSGRGRLDLWEGPSQTKSLRVFNANGYGVMGMVSAENLELWTSGTARVTINGSTGVTTFAANAVVNAGADSRVLVQNGGTTVAQLQATASEARLHGVGTIPVSLWSDGVKIIEASTSQVTINNRPLVSTNTVTASSFIGSASGLTGLKTVNGNSILGSGNIQIDGGVTSFNTRTGAVTLSSGDVTGALGYTPLSTAGGTLTGTLTGTTVNAILESSNARIKFKAADADGGTFALLGLDWGGAVGTYKDFEVYDYVNGRTMFRLFGATRNAEIYGALSINGNTALHAGNVSSYALPLGGGTLTGALTGTSFSDGYITWSAAQINRPGSNVELQWAGTAGSTVFIGANGPKPIRFYADTGNALFSGSVRLGGGTSNPASTGFSHTLAGIGTNRVVNFDGNGNGTPSVWWTNGSRAYGAIDATDPGLTFWANNGSSWQKQITMNYGFVNVDTVLQQGGNQVLHAGNVSSYALPISGGTLTGSLILPANYDLSWGGSYSTGKATLSAGTGGIYLYATGNSSGNTFAFTPSANNSLVALQQSGNQVLHAGNYSTYSPSYGYFDDYQRGAYRVIADHGSQNTWYIRSNGRFTWARAHDWSQSFDLDLGSGTTNANDGWARFGQQTSNSTAGTWRGTRFVQYTGGTSIDGFVRAGRYYLGDDSNYLLNAGDGSLRVQTGNGYVDIGPKNSSWCHIYSDRDFYTNRGIWISGSRVLDAGNYTSYSPSLTGSGASGTWGISITGNAGSSTGAYQLYTDTGSKSNGLQYWQTSDDSTLNPNGNWHYAIRMSHGDAATYYSATLALDFHDDVFQFRRKVNGTNQSWRTLLHSGNFGSYALPLSGGTVSGSTRIDSTLTMGGYNNSNGYIAFNNAGTYWGLIGNHGTNDWRLAYGSPGSIVGWSLRWDASGNVVVNGNLSAGTAVTSGGNTGFRNDVYYGAVRNPIWSFGNAGAYGISYFQGSAGIGGTDAIGIHPNGTATAAGSSFAVVGNGDTRAANNSYAYAFRGHSNVAGTGEASYHPAGIYSTGTNWLYGQIITSGASINAGGATCTLTATRANRANGNFYIDDNFGCGIVGNYSASRYQGVFFMGDSYKMSADGTSLANMYGMAWSHPNAGGAAGNLTDHGLLIINNGGFRCAISNSIVASGNITAYSDERLKTNWRDMPENFVARLAQVKVGIYDRLDEEDVTQVGVSAQSFQELLPQAIMTAKDEMQTLSVSYGNAALASTVELAKDNVELRARIERLEALVEKLIGD